MKQLMMFCVAFPNELWSTTMLLPAEMEEAGQWQEQQTVFFAAEGGKQPWGKCHSQTEDLSNCVVFFSMMVMSGMQCGAWE